MTAGLARIGRASLGIALCLGGAGCLSALAGGPGDLGAPADTGWLSARAGVGLVDTLQVGLEEPGQGAASALAFGVGLHYRTARFDVGGLFEGFGASRHGDAGREAPIGSSFRAAGTLRWRYLEQPWGALYLRLAPALMVLGHSDALRDRVAGFVEGDREAVDALTVAFSLGADAGLLVYLSEGLALSLGVDLVTAATTVGTEVGGVGYNTVRGLFTVGLEWRM